ncbi:RRM domain-containing protein [Cryptosporidium canis]|uniref:RRM domain-containing protein n=1 Tax=Cryptosporidium canis TaxID=195482 RepID=A0ABQ8P2A4_9CRYT|nr:RRM domain-containing protein [Cryptosporidium canis]KAJ1608363.1 RRM domain-containing protein [Cryptosporidium canis]
MVKGLQSVSNKILVDGLSEQITKDQLVRHFERFGNIENCQYIQVMNFAIVTFSEKGVTENALRSPHVIMGREVNCRLYCDKLEDLSGESSQGTMFRTEKIFVGNLPTTCSQDILRKYFEQFGQISDCVMMCDKKSGIGRGFGFVTFTNTNVVDEIIRAYDEHYIDGQWVEVKRASPENALRGGNMSCNSISSLNATNLSTREKNNTNLLIKSFNSNM